MTNIEQFSKKSSLDDFKEKARSEFYEMNGCNFGIAEVDSETITDWWLEKLDQAVQARNEELVELGRKLDDSIDYEPSTDPIEYSNGYHRAIKDITKLISPGRK